MAGFYCLNNFIETITAKLDDALSATGKILLGCPVTIRALTTKKGDPHAGTIFAIELALHFGLLLQHRVFNNYMINTGNILGVNAQRLTLVNQRQQQFLLTLLIPDRFILIAWRISSSSMILPLKTQNKRQRYKS